MSPLQAGVLFALWLLGLALIMWLSRRGSGPKLPAASMCLQYRSSRRCWVLIDRQGRELACRLESEGRWPGVKEARE